MLIKKIQDLGWEADRLVAEIIDSGDLYFDRVSQVKASTWHIGRVALTGDAAYCATPITGKGIDLSMSGAYILAGELSKNSDHQTCYFFIFLNSLGDTPYFALNIVEK